VSRGKHEIGTAFLELVAMNTVVVVDPKWIPWITLPDSFQGEHCEAVVTRRAVVVRFGNETVGDDLRASEILFGQEARRFVASGLGDRCRKHNSADDEDAIDLHSVCLMERGFSYNEQR
jgi:hypothetical protein